MEVCGTHTMAIAKFGLRQLLPPEIELLSGPGCPVCVTSQGDIDVVLELASRSGVTLFTFGDMLRVPGSSGSLERVRAQGANVIICFSPLDCLQYALAHPQEEVVFLGVGFETTAPAVAVAMEQALVHKATNFSVLSLHKRIVPALRALVSEGTGAFDGFILPGHASSILGRKPYEFLAREYKKACVITGFAAIDILLGILMLLEQVENKSYQVEIQYKRGVNPEGNPQALAYLAKYFTPIDSAWRGLGTIPMSGLGIAERYMEFDASRRFSLQLNDKAIPTACSCGEILKGLKKPEECILFAKECTPLEPVGPCMVSSEGACAASYHYGR